MVARDSILEIDATGRPLADKIQLVRRRNKKSHVSYLSAARGTSRLSIIKERREHMMTFSVIIGSTRQGRFSEKPAQWILS